MKIAEGEKLEKDLARNKVCQEFLSEVCVHLTEDYHEIQDLLNRYQTLKNANEDLSNKQKDIEVLSNMNTHTSESLKNAPQRTTYARVLILFFSLPQKRCAPPFSLSLSLFLGGETRVRSLRRSKTS